MNILEGIKPSTAKPQNSTNTKFIIKSKPSVKENRPTQPQSQPTYASTQDVHQLITYMVAKSKRLGQLLDSKGITDAAEFHNKNMYENACVRTFLKSIMDKMLAERRLGRGLKGINKGILTEIENLIWTTLEREVSLYQLDKLYNKEKKALQTELQQRRREIQKQIEQLKTQQLETDLMVLGESNTNEKIE